MISELLDERKDEKNCDMWEENLSGSSWIWVLCVIVELSGFV